MRIISFVLYLIGAAVFYYVRITDKEDSGYAEAEKALEQTKQELGLESYKKAKVAFYIGLALGSLLWPMLMFPNFAAAIIRYRDSE